MSDSTMLGMAKQVIRKVFPASANMGHGPISESNDGWVDPKPYDDVYANGIFRGYDGFLWMYFRCPEDVKVEFNRSQMDAVRNQHFFTTLVNELAAKINDQTQKTRRDTRRLIHVQLTQDQQYNIKPYPDCSPAHADYLERMSSRYIKPIWNGYIGIQLHGSSMYSGAETFESRWDRYKELMTNPDAVQAHLYAQDIDELSILMADCGFTQLNFEEDMEDYERLTAWHGVADDDYALPRQLVSTRVQEPLHGKSLIVPRWGEVTFHAVKPSDKLFMIDPISSRARWSTPMFAPASNVVCINMKFQIRSADAAENMFSQKRTIKVNERNRVRGKGEQVSDTEMEKVTIDSNRLDKARQSSAVGNALIDNAEIIVATKVISGKRNPLPGLMASYDMEVVPLIGRQPQALNSTFPCYSKPIYRVNSGNNRRSVLSSQMYAAAIGLSGVFRKTRPCAEGGIILGLSESGHEYTEIYTDVEGANKNDNVPGMLITGRPGAGKSQEMIQIVSQLAYQEFRAFFLNPKPDATMKPSFDLIGGLTINMNARYLEDNPGLMDPMFFLEDRDEIKNTLTSAIILTTGLNRASGDRAQETIARRTKLETEIQDRLSDRRNRCSHHIIFGNQETGTPGISDKEIINVLKDKMKSSPFWKSFVSVEPDAHSDLREQLISGRPVLIEWDKSLQLPTVTDDPSTYTDAQIDSVISLTTAFKYAVEIVGNGRQGGAIMCDEAWVLQASPDAMKIVQKGAREWRQHNIMLILGTQRITDFLRDGEGDLTTYFARYLFMAISEGNETEIKEYLRITGLQDSEENRRFITTAGIKSEDGRKQKKIAPRAFYVDRLYGWSGAIICGPFPERELNAGRTDKAAEMARAHEQNISRKTDGGVSETFGGFLNMITMENDVVSESVTQEAELEAD